MKFTYVEIAYQCCPTIEWIHIDSVACFLVGTPVYFRACWWVWTLVSKPVSRMAGYLLYKQIYQEFAHYFLLYIIKKWIMLKEYWNIIKKCRLPGVIVLLYGVLDFLAEAILKELSLSLRLSGVPALSEERDARDCPIGTLRALRSLTYAT